MTAADVWDEMQEVPRDRWGRPYITPPEGGKPVAYTRCTTFVKCLDDTTNLTAWKQRMTALGLAQRPDLQMAVATTKPGDKTALDRIVAQAMEAAASKAAATTGTAIHKLTEKVDRGESLDGVPAQALPDLYAYQSATAGLTVTDIEAFGVHDGLQVAGTWDRGFEIGGRRYIGDIKTGSLEYAIGAISMQLAVYAHCLRYDLKTSQRTDPGYDRDRAIIVHLPAGQAKCDLLWVDIHAGMEGVSIARDVRQWRKAATMKALTEPFDDMPAALFTPAMAPLVAPGADPGAVSEALVQALLAANSDAAMEALWREYSGAWGPEHTEAAARRSRELKDPTRNNPSMTGQRQ